MAINFNHTSAICPVCNLLDAYSSSYEIRLVSKLKVTASRYICKSCYENLYKGMVELTPDEV